MSYIHSCTVQAGEKWRIPNPPTFLKRNWKTIIPPESNKKSAARPKRPVNGVAAAPAAPQMPAVTTSAAVAAAAAATAAAAPAPAAPAGGGASGGANGANRPKQKRDGHVAVNGGGSGTQKQTAHVKPEPAVLNSVMTSLPPVDMSQPPQQVPFSHVSATCIHLSGSGIDFPELMLCTVYIICFIRAM